MNHKERVKKLEPTYEALLEKGINPNAITKNPLFVSAAKQFVDRDIDLPELVSLAEKINILAGGKYSVNQTLEA